MTRRAVSKEEPASGVLLIERAQNNELSPIRYEAARTWGELVAMCTNYGDRRVQVINRIG